MRIWLDPEKLTASRAEPERRHQRHPAAEPGGGRRPGRRAASPRRPGVPVHGQHRGAPRRPRAVREHHRQDRRPERRRRSMLRDIGRVELGAQTYSTVPCRRPAGRRHRASTSFPTPTRSTSARRSRPRWTALARRFPQGLAYASPSTPRRFVRPRSTRSTRRSTEAGILVLIVILVFLQDWRATLVPATTVPVTIIGAFAAWRRSASRVNLLDAVRHRAGDRHRGRRRHRHRRGRRPAHGAGHDRPRRPPSRRWTSCSVRSSASRWC